MSPKILVIRLSSLGDVVLTGPVYKSLKAHWPGCRVTVLVKPQFAAALKGHPGVDEVVPFTGIMDALRLIKARGFTHLLDLHGNLRSFVIRTMARVPNTATYRKHALGRRLFVALRVSSPGLQLHTVDRYHEALATWGVPRAASVLSSADYGAAGATRGAKKILVMQSAFLGDSLLTLPLLRRLKEILPGGTVTVLTLAGTAAIFRGTPWVDSVMIDDKRGAHGGLTGPWRVAEELRARAFDLAVIPHRSLRSALIAKLAGIPRRIGFDSSAGSFLLTDAVPFSWLMHDLERNLSLALPLGAGAAPSAGESRYVAPPKMTPKLAGLLSAAGDGAVLAGVHPGSAWATKRWLPERFAELCVRLKADGLTPVLVGGPDDKALGARIAEDCGALDLVGRTDLEELKALMGRLSLFVTNDSGPMHLAAAAGVPVVAIFGATTRELGFFPYGPGHRVVEAPLACRPCGLHGARVCPEGHFLCMRLLTVDRVHEACRDILKAEVAAAGIQEPRSGS
ncbi:MAG: lipopolysaccharide heptosyltransferase II [Elusimicrobia bacterium]|nr:lipopolysaccharide heptosyltransferase II [Elusimicrobiota bacterium]